MKIGKPSKNFVDKKLKYKEVTNYNLIKTQKLPEKTFKYTEFFNKKY